MDRDRAEGLEKFRQLRQFLEEEEKRLLNHVEEVEKEIAGRRDEQLAKLSRKLSSLDSIIHEMEEKCQQPVSELLQDVRSTLQRYEKRESPEKPLPFPPELRNQNLESCDLNHLVEDTMKQWKAALSSASAVKIFHSLHPYEATDSCPEGFWTEVSPMCGGNKPVGKSAFSILLKSLAMIRQMGPFIVFLFTRYEKRESPEKPLPFPPELRNQNLESCDLNHLVEDTMKQWKDALLYRKLIQKEVQSFRNLQRANVTLDPDTAHPSLILSKDRKILRLGNKKQFLPNNPERFSYWFCVLGREGFTAGRRFWEVNVGSGEEWDVGVARKSVRRKGHFPIRPEEGVWAVEKCEGKYWALTSPDSDLSLNEDPRRIRVTLDYEGGCVSFSDADSGTELYTFSGASFSGETLLPFFYLNDFQTHLSIS
nr:zinc-binding protein A33-like [Zootoca vivipara]